MVPEREAEGAPSRVYIIRMGKDFQKSRSLDGFLQGDSSGKAFPAGAAA